MKKSRFTETQIVAVLREADTGVKVADICHKHGISMPTYYSWKSKYGGLGVSEHKRIKELEAEHSKLKRMYAALAMDHEALKELLEKSLGASRTPHSGRLARGRTWTACQTRVSCRELATLELVSPAKCVVFITRRVIIHQEKKAMC